MHKVKKCSTELWKNRNRVNSSNWCVTWTIKRQMKRLERQNHASPDFKPVAMNHLSLHMSPCFIPKTRDRCLCRILQWTYERAGQATECVHRLSSQVWCNTLQLIWLGLVPAADSGDHLWPTSVVSTNTHSNIRHTNTHMPAKICFLAWSLRCNQKLRDKQVHHHNRTNTQQHKHTTAQTHSSTNTQQHKHTAAQTHNRTNTQQHKHTAAQTHSCTWQDIRRVEMASDVFLVVAMLHSALWIKNEHVNVQMHNLMFL